MNLSKLISIPEIEFKHVSHQSNLIEIQVSIRAKKFKCPNCGKFSKSVHDFYWRQVTDLPVFDNITRIHVKTRKFRCLNMRCSRKVFSEQSSFLEKYSRRTKRVGKVLDSLSIELTSNKGSRLSSILMIRVSPSTLTRIAHRQKLPQIKSPKVLGVDDWAFRKGVNYGTILLDMETSKPIDLLPTRDYESLKEWLIKYPDIQIVTRDRSSSYASAINDSCPQAIQVADRFHLIVNLSDALDRFFKFLNPEIKRLIKQRTADLADSYPQFSNSEPFRNSQSLNANLTMEINIPKQDQRLDVFNKVKELQADGLSKRRISMELDMSRTTVSSYFEQRTLAPKAKVESTNIRIFTKIIVDRLNVNGYMIKDIVEEITRLGYTGSKSQAYLNINRIKSEQNITTIKLMDQSPISLNYIKPLSSRKLASLIGLDFDKIRGPMERKYVEIVLESIPVAQIVRRLVRMFREMMKVGQGNIKRWISFIQKSKYKLPGLKSFANGMVHDLAAIENAITSPWSNGATEGHVNRIKTIKRQMYGRASFELLRRKVILSQSG